MALRSVLEMVIGSRFKDRGVKDAKKSAKSLDKDIRKIAAGFGVVTAAAVGFGVAAKKAFDLGREGAVVLQTAESFDLLMEKVNASEGLLDDLREAAKGTVDDMTIMSSTATLLAGASGDLATELANATPELLEIAKAANKLNPALGTTTFMYESIATGVKRAQPLILDNLGLTIKVGEANQKFADQLGITVDKLTAEQKAQALLNDTLRAGKILIDQVGGSTDAAADNYDRLTTSLKNWTDELKKEINNRSEYVNILATNVEFLELSLKAVRENVISHQERNLMLREVMSTELTAIEALEDLNVRVDEHTAFLAEANTATDSWMVALGFLKVATEEEEGALDDLAESDLSPLEQQFKNARTAIDLTRQASNNLWDNMNTGIQGSIDRLQEQIDFMQAGGTRVQSAFEEVESALKAGLIAPDEAETALRDIELAAIAVQTETGAIDMTDAIEQVRDEWNVSWQEAKNLIEASIGLIDAIPAITEKRIEFFIEYTGAAPPGGQHGLNMVVPQGFPNDTFPVLASSGERVTITPAGQATPEGPGGVSVLVTGNSFAGPVDFEESVENALREILA